MTDKTMRTYSDLQVTLAIMIDYLCVGGGATISKIPFKRGFLIHNGIIVKVRTN